MLLRTTLLSLVCGCATMEIHNASSGPVDVQVGSFSEDARTPSATIEEGDTQKFSANVPFGASPRIVATGTFVFIDEDLPRGEAYIILDNAGVLEITNTGDEPIDNVFLRTATELEVENPDHIVRLSVELALADWGDSYGEIAPDEAISITRPPADDYLIRGDNSIRPGFEVEVGIVTAVAF